MTERRNFARQYTFEDGRLNEELDRLFIEAKRLWSGKVKEYAEFPIISFDNSQSFTVSGDGIGLLASVTANMQNGDGKTNIYTVPDGKNMHVFYIVIRNPSGSLAGGTNFSLGDGANADTWATTINLDGMVNTTDSITIVNYGVTKTIFDAADVFGIKPVTGATADVTAKIDLFGYTWSA